MSRPRAGVPPRLPVLRRVAACLAAALVCAAALAAGACGPSGPVQAAIPGDVLADAPWEAGYAPDEPTEDLHDVVWTPADPRDPAAKGGPAAGARVELLLPRPDGRPPLTPAGETVAAEDGSFTFRGVPRGPYVYRVSVPGHAVVLAGRGAHARGVMDLDPGVPHSLGSRPGRTLTGRVVDRDGKAVPGVAVEAMSFAYLERTTTGVDGGFSLLVPDGRVGLAVMDAGWDPARTTSDPGQGPVEIRTVATAPLAGVVLTTEDERPVEGAVVVWNEDPSQRAESDAAGRFSLRVPRTGTVAVLGAGLAWRTYDIPVAGDMELRLHPAQAVRGKVVDAAGRPVRDARILAIATSPPFPSERAVGPRTAADGTFEMTWVPRTAGRGRVSLLAWHRRLGLSPVVVVAALDEGRLPAPSAGGTGEDQPLLLALSGLGDVAGRIVDARGTPQAGARVGVRWYMEPLDDYELGILGMPRDLSTSTDASGAFLLRDVPMDRRISVVASSYGIAIEKFVEPREPRGALRFEFPQGGRVSGHVVTRKGEPPGAACHVSARLVDHPGIQLERSVDTGPDGAFAFEDMPPGRYIVEARADGFDLPSSADAHPGDTDVRIVVERSARLSARLVVVAAAGEARERPTVPLRVWIEDAADATFPAGRLDVQPADVPGPIPLGRYHPGKWRVRVEGGDWRGLLSDVELDDGEERTVDVEILRTLVVRGRVTDSAGRPVATEQVKFVPVEGAAGTPVVATTGADGAVETAGLRPGTWEITVAPRFQAALVQRVVCPTTGPVDLKLPPYGDLEVRVLRPDGEPEAGAIVSIAGTDGESALAWSEQSMLRGSRFRVGDDGVARMRGLPVGPVRVSAAVGSTRRADVTVEVVAGKTVEATVK